MPIILYKYIASRFLRYILVVFCTLAGVILIFDLIELLRILIKSESVNFAKIFMMALMKNYYHANKIWPFIILISGLLTYRKFAFSFELYALKNAGLSTSQLLLPIILSSFIIGVLHSTILHSIDAYFIQKYQHIEAEFLHGRKSLITPDKHDIWIKDNKINAFIHALRLSKQDQTLHEVTILYSDTDYTFLKRIDAKKAQIHQYHWTLLDCNIIDKSFLITKQKEVQLPIEINFEKIMARSLDPKTLSFWQLYGIINAKEQSGITMSQYKLYFCELLLSPVVFSAIGAMSYAFSTINPRQKEQKWILCIALLTQFAIYFLCNVFSALALSGNLNIIFAALFPVFLYSIVATYTLLLYEFS